MLARFYLSPVSFVKEKNAFSETAPTHFLLCLSGENEDAWTLLVIKLARRANICLLICLLVFPIFCSGRQTRGWSLETAIGSQSSSAGVPRHKLLLRKSGPSEKPAGGFWPQVCPLFTSTSSHAWVLTLFGLKTPLCSRKN